MACSLFNYTFMGMKSLPFIILDQGNIYAYSRQINGAASPLTDMVSYSMLLLHPWVYIGQVQE